jgi:hypothetical protein
VDWLACLARGRCAVWSSFSLASFEDWVGARMSGGLGLLLPPGDPMTGTEFCPARRPSCNVCHSFCSVHAQHEVKCSVAQVLNFLLKLTTEKCPVRTKLTCTLDSSGRSVNKFPDYLSCFSGNRIEQFYLSHRVAVEATLLQI